MMTRPPCKWLRENGSDNFNPWHCSYHIDISWCDRCEIYEVSKSTCPTCKHYDNSTDNEEEFCHALGEVIGDTAMGNSKIINCEYWCEDNLKDDYTVVKVRNSCKYLDVDNDTQKFICHYTSLNGGASMVLSGDICSKCNYYEPKEPQSMKVLQCKYQSETSNKCQKLPNCNVYPCAFEVANEWDAAKVRCKYFERHDTGILRDILRKIDDNDLTFLETMLKDDPEWTMKQISYSLSGRYDP